MFHIQPLHPMPWSKPTSIISFLDDDSNLAGLPVSVLNITSSPPLKPFSRGWLGSNLIIPLLRSPEGDTGWLRSRACDSWSPGPEFNLQRLQGPVDRRLLSYPTIPSPSPLALPPPLQTNEPSPPALHAGSQLRQFVTTRPFLPAVFRLHSEVFHTMLPFHEASFAFPRLKLLSHPHPHTLMYSLSASLLYLLSKLAFALSNISSVLRAHPIYCLECDWRVQLLVQNLPGDFSGLTTGGDKGSNVASSQRKAAIPAADLAHSRGIPVSEGRCSQGPRDPSQTRSFTDLRF